ncbi:Vacuolar calcium ion transporter [Cladobotryum mycophilum]|uniref:Vacuolar calcium ion transporter n=1 Tax=Cladobotryum mycophilum TaxID=491253 RepID=A0ABR0SC26_9HYPO
MGEPTTGYVGFSEHPELPVPAGGGVDEESALLPPDRHPESCRSKLRTIIKAFTPSSYTILLLGFIPLGIIFGVLDKPHRYTFWFNFLAILPLSQLISRKLRRLSAILGPQLGGILHALLDNALLLIICIAAIQNGDPRVAQSCVLGSVLANLLLEVVGSCFLIGGIRHSESIFSSTYASTASSLMIVASTSLVVPSAISEVHCRINSDCEDELVRMSRAVSLALLFLFSVYLHYRLRSHRVLFVDPLSQVLDGLSDTGYLLFGILEAMLLLAVLALASTSAHFLVRTLGAAADFKIISNRVASFVLLPLAADGPARIEAIMAAYRNEMDRSLNFAIGRSMHVALFVTPILVLFSWAVQSSHPMTLHFPTLETVSIFFGTLLVAELCRDGKSDYLEGAMCLVTYLILSFSF